MIFVGIIEALELIKTIQQKHIRIPFESFQKIFDKIQSLDEVILILILILILVLIILILITIYDNNKGVQDEHMNFLLQALSHRNQAPKIFLNNLGTLDLTIEGYYIIIITIIIIIIISIIIIINNVIDHLGITTLLGTYCIDHFLQIELNRIMKEGMLVSPSLLSLSLILLLLI